MKKDRKYSRLEQTVLRDTTITRKQKKEIFKILGKKYPVGKEVNPIKNLVSDLAVNLDGKKELQPFDMNRCSTRLKTLLTRIHGKEDMNVGKAVEILLNNKIERLKGGGANSVIELSVILKSILVNQFKMKKEKGV